MKGSKIGSEVATKIEIYQCAVSVCKNWSDKIVLITSGLCLQPDGVDGL